MSDYPKTKYHKLGGGSIRVLSETQDKLLGPDWMDIPRPEPEKPIEPFVEEVLVPIETRKAKPWYDPRKK